MNEEKTLYPFTQKGLCTRQLQILKQMGRNKEKGKDGRTHFLIRERKKKKDEIKRYLPRTHFPYENITIKCSMYHSHTKGS